MGKIKKARNYLRSLITGKNDSFKLNKCSQGHNIMFNSLEKIKQCPECGQVIRVDKNYGKKEE